MSRRRVRGYPGRINARDGIRAALAELERLGRASGERGDVGDLLILLARLDLLALTLSRLAGELEAPAPVPPEAQSID